VGHELTFGRELGSPGELRTFQAAARRKFPFSLSRQVLSRPLRIGRCILESDMDHWMFRETFQRTARSARMSPTRARYVSPPVEMVLQINWNRRLVKDHRRRHEHLRQRTGIVFRSRRAFSRRHVISLFNKPAELRIGNGELVHPETI